MTHEFRNIIKAYLNAQHLGLSCVLATVVDLDGSSYRRPGVRMLINAHGQMTGAVSGGCVEKEVLKQAHTVFKTGKAKVMTYDGRYRLGCEGTLYILIETFNPSSDLLKTFQGLLEDRGAFEIKSTYRKGFVVDQRMGSQLYAEDDCFAFNGAMIEKGLTEKEEDTTASTEEKGELRVFSQCLKPRFKLNIVGAEHDAAALSSMAANLGWEVEVIVSPSNPSQLKDFPGAEKLTKRSADDIDFHALDRQNAVVLMTHSYVKDLEYMLSLKDSKPLYIGLLGPSNRREKMFDDLMERVVDLDERLFDRVFGPAGLNIGSETPQEIALSICAEILSVLRAQEPKPLKDKIGSIHMGIRL